MVSCTSNVRDVGRTLVLYNSGSVFLVTPVQMVRHYIFLRPRKEDSGSTT